MNDTKFRTLYRSVGKTLDIVAPSMFYTCHINRTNNYIAGYPGVTGFPLHPFILHETDLTQRKSFSFLKEEVGVRLHRQILTSW